MTPERDESTAKALAVVFGPIVAAADNVPTAIDVRGYRSATLALAVGIGGITFDTTNKVDFVLTHSFDDTTYTAVTDDDVIKDALAPAFITNGIVRSLVAAHAAPTVQKLGYIGGRAYLKLLSDFSGTHGTGTPLAAIVVKEEAEFQGAN